MSASALISELSERGVRLRPDGQNVSVSPRKALTPCLLERIKAAKPKLVRELERIRREAGEEWEEISSDPKQLKAFYELLMIADMRARGIAPDHYTSVTSCRHCGPVPIWEGCAPVVHNCPWCFNRLKGLPIPRNAG